MFFMIDIVFMKTFLKNLTFLLLAATPAMAQESPPPGFSIVPIKDLQYEGNTLIIQYILPCGIHKVGLVAAPGAGGKMRIGILAKQSAVLCAAIPSLIRERVPFFNYSGIKVLVKMAAANRRGELQVKPPVRLHLTSGPGRSLAQAVYETGCADFGGFVIDASGAQLKVGILEVTRKTPPRKTCSMTQAIKTLDFLNVKKSSLLNKLDLHRSSPVEAFHLRLARIRPASVTTTTTGGLNFEYWRRCNEVPIGPVVGDVANGKTQIGMVVAHFYNRRCVLNMKQIWAHYSSREFHVGWSPTVALMPPSKGLGRYRVLAPIQYAIDPRHQDRQLILEYIGGCQQEVGAVYGRDSFGNLSVGILQKNDDSPCKNSPKEVSLYQPYNATTAKLKIFPMKVDGATYF